MATTAVLLKVREVAAMLNVHRNSVRRMIEDGRLKSVWLGPRSVRVPVAEVERMAREGTSQ